MRFFENTHQIPPLLNPARNPLLPWLIAPFGLLLGLLGIYLAIEQDYLLKFHALNGCTINRDYQRSKKLVNTRVICLEMPDERFHFRSLKGNTEEILTALEGKRVNIEFYKGNFESNIKEITFKGISYEGRTILTDGTFERNLFGFCGVFTCLGAIFIWILKVHRK